MRFLPGYRSQLSRWKLTIPDFQFEHFPSLSESQPVQTRALEHSLSAQPTPPRRPEALARMHGTMKPALKTTLTSGAGIINCGEVWCILTTCLFTWTNSETLAGMHSLKPQAHNLFNGSVSFVPNPPHHPLLGAVYVWLWMLIASLFKMGKHRLNAFSPLAKFYFANWQSVDYTRIQ